MSSNGSPYSEVRLGIGAAGIAAKEGGAIGQGIAFGFGDEDAGIKGDSFGMQSPIADATIIPEPATLLSALAAAGAVWVSRRRRPVGRVPGRPARSDGRQPSLVHR